MQLVMCSDYHDNALFWYGNASTALTRSNRWLYSMVSHCMPHGINLIGKSLFRNKPQKALMCTRLLSSLRAGSGNETSGTIQDYDALKSWHFVVAPYKITMPLNYGIL